MRVVLASASHYEGRLPSEAVCSLLPSAALLSITAYCHAVGRTQVTSECVWDSITADLNEADIVGLSCWSSNYFATCQIAAEIKQKAPRTAIVLGGPHISGLGASRVLGNNGSVDYVVIGDGECAVAGLAAQHRPDLIAGLAWRSGEGSGKIRVCTRPCAIPLDDIPPFQKYAQPPKAVCAWQVGEPSYSAFPISTVRGCPTSPRCEYCSIPGKGVRLLSPARFWSDVLALNDHHGIDFFFETGDVFPFAYATRLLAERHVLAAARREQASSLRFKIYLRPGKVTQRSAAILRRLNTKVAFIGYESVLCFGGETGDRARQDALRTNMSTVARKYRSDFDLASALREVRTLAASAVTVMPSFILGLPGESPSSLRQNTELIRTLAGEPNVHEMVVSAIVPLPGSRLFDWCVGDKWIVGEFARQTELDLRVTDKIDFRLLSDLFIERFTNVSPDDVRSVLTELEADPPCPWANWNQT